MLFLRKLVKKGAELLFSFDNGFYFSFSSIQCVSDVYPISSAGGLYSRSRNAFDFPSGWTGGGSEIRPWGIIN